MGEEVASPSPPARELGSVVNSLSRVRGRAPADKFVLAKINKTNRLAERIIKPLPTD